MAITVNKDALYEHAEDFTVTLGNVMNAAIGDGTATGTITDNDAAPTFTVDSVSQAEGDSGTSTMTFTVTKNGASGQASHVNYATADGTATTAQPVALKDGIVFQTRKGALVHVVVR